MWKLKYIVIESKNLKSTVERNEAVSFWRDYFSYVWAYIVRDKQILRFYFVSGVYKIGATVIRTEKKHVFYVLFRRF